MMQLISGLITGLDCFIIFCGRSHDFSLHKLTYVGYVNQAGVSIKTHLCGVHQSQDPPKTVHNLPKDQAIRNARLKCIFINMPEGF